MAAEDMRVNGALMQVVAQVSGHKMGPYSFVADPDQVNDTEQYDFFDGDIGLTWDMLDGRCALAYGDCGGAEFQGGFGLRARTKATRSVNATFVPRLASNFGLGADQSSIIGLNSVGAAVPTSGILHVQTGVGPGGWATFTYDGKFTVPSPGLSGVVFLVGGGTVSPGQSVVIGELSTTGDLCDPRTNGGYRGNLLAVGSTEDLGSGVIIDEMLTHADGCAIEALPFTLDPASVTDCYPTIGSGGIQVAGIERISGFVTITTATPHGITTGGRHNPTGPPIYLENIYTVGTTLTGGPIDTATATTITCASKFGFVTGGGTTGAMRRIAVQITSGPNAGRYSIIEYTSCDLTHFFGCTVVNGVTGTAATGAAIRQGFDTYDSGGTLLTNRDLLVHDVPSTTTVRCIMSFQPDKAGGLFTGTKLHIADIDTSDPPTAQHAGLFPVGGFSVPHTGATNNVRHCVFALDSYANGAIAYSTGVGLHYSDTGGLAGTWTRAPSGTWNQESDQTALIRGMCAHYDADDNAGWGAAYVLGITAPQPLLWRVAVGLELDRANYEYFTGGDPANPANWSNDETDAEALDWSYALGQRAASVTSLSLRWLETFSCWMVTYFPGGEGNDLRLLCRFSDDLVTWTVERSIFQASNFPFTAPVGGAANPGYVYGGFIHPWSGACRPDLGNDPDTIVMTVTPFLTYNVLAVEVPLYSVEAGADMGTTEHGKRVSAGGEMEGFHLQKNDGWVYTDQAWTRVDADTITCVGDMTAFIRKYDCFSCHDGTATRYAYVLSVSYNDASNGLTTVNLIPNNEGASAGSILSNGSITAVKYSHDDRPAAFPGTFTWSPSVTGFSAVPTNAVYSYSIHRGRMRVDVREATGGSSNNATHTIPLPTGVAAKTRTNSAWQGPANVVDNGTGKAGSLIVTSGGTAITASTSFALAGWATTGTTNTNVGIGTIEFELA